MPSLRDRLDGAVLRALMGLPEAVQRRLLRHPVVVDGQTLAAETQLMLALQRLIREPAIETLPVPQARRGLVRQAGLVGGHQPIGAIRDLVVGGAQGDLPARLYLPSSGLGADPAPTLMFFHGGGWVYGDLASHDAAIRHLAERSGVQVLAVDYRLAPEDPFPAAVDDAEAAYRWLVGHAGAVNADPARLAVGGDSAGGNLAAATALAAAREGLPLAFQLLVYPAVDFTGEAPSRERFGEGFFLTRQFMDQCKDWYLPDESAWSDPRASVLLADVPEGLAPAYVVTAAFDPLRDEGEAYAAKLRAAGVPVEARRFPGMIHGFFNVVGAGRVARGFNREIAGRLAAALG